MNKLRQMSIIFLLVSSTSGCVNGSATNWEEPICVSHNDVLTEGTKQQIVTHNETLGKPCTKQKK